MGVNINNKKVHEHKQRERRDFLFWLSNYVTEDKKKEITDLVVLQK